MSVEEKIRKYLEGELSPDELIFFEKEIINSPGLKKEIETYEAALRQFKTLENLKSEENYFVNIIPRFRERFIHKKSIFNPSYAVGSIVIILSTVIVFFIMNNNPEMIEDEQITFEQLDDEEIKEYLNNYEQEISTIQLSENISEEYDSVFNSMMENELSLDTYPVDYFVDISNNEFDNLIDELSEEEKEGIYKSLIQKDFN